MASCGAALPTDLFGHLFANGLLFIVLGMAGADIDPEQSAIIENLVRRGADGDRQAQNDLLAQYWPLIQAVVRGRRARMGASLKNREETSDLAQDVAVEVLQSLAKQQWQGRAAFGAWIRKLAEYQVIDAQRFHGRKKRNGAMDTGVDKADRGRMKQTSEESRIDRSRRMEMMMASISDLKEEYAAALILHYQGYSHAEIGTCLDCSAEAARKLVSRGRAKLSQMLQG